MNKFNILVGIVLAVFIIVPIFIPISTILGILAISYFFIKEK